MTMLTKRFSGLKAQESGEVESVIATLNVKDSDGDVTKPGFFGTQKTAIVGSHNWSDIMLGKGTVTEDGEKAVFKGKLNLDDPAGKALHSKLMFDMAHDEPLIEWSYGFEVLPGGAKQGDHNGEQVQILGPKEDGSPGAKVWEVSPVLAGAGVGTGTLGVKSKTLTDKITQAVTDLTGLKLAVSSLVDQLTEDGLELTAAKAASLEALRESLHQTLETVSKALEQPKPDPDPLTLEGLHLLEAQYENLRRVTTAI